MEKITIVLATKNKNKIVEIEALLQAFPVTLMNLGDFGTLPDVAEDAESFEDNAYLKASFYARILGFPSLADDSGLVVEALGGAPGVHSHRWAGDTATDEDKCSLLLQKMAGVKNRRAAFVCALALAVPSGPALTWVGRAEGELTLAPRGWNGFGYDPVFLYPPLGKTFAELSREEKGRVSHRGQALSEFKSEFDKVIIWMRQRLGDEKAGD